MKQTILGIILLSSLCGAQPAKEALSFEVASVKPGTDPQPIDMGGGRMMIRGGGCQGGPGTTDLGRWSCQSTSLTSLVTAAYNLKRYQIGPSSFPKWMDDAKFDVTAKVPADISKEDFRIMQQNLLKERFKLAVHFDKKEMQVYDLTIGKNGSKLVPAPVATDPAPEPNALPPALPSMAKMERDKDGFPVMPRRSGGMSMSVMNGRMRLQASDQTMEQFTSLLINQLAKPVTDLTELKGKYDITLTFAADSAGGMGMMTMRMTGSGGGGGGAASADAGPTPGADTEPAPTLLEAVQQQLGLKLEPKKGTVDLIVVDHAEKTPIEN